MVNDIQKLQKVIDSLEEEASQVREFTGILRAVSEAHAKIEVSNATLSSLSSELKQLIKDSYSKFDGLEKRLSDLEKQQVDLVRGQDSVRCAISELKFVSPAQFEHGRDKVLLKLTELNFLTPAQYQDGSRATNETLKLLVADLAQKIEQTNQAHQASLRTLRAVTMWGMLTLAGGIAYLRYAS